LWCYCARHPKATGTTEAKAVSCRWMSSFPDTGGEGAGIPIGGRSMTKPKEEEERADFFFRGGLVAKLASIGFRADADRTLQGPAALYHPTVAGIESPHAREMKKWGGDPDEGKGKGIISRSADTDDARHQTNGAPTRTTSGAGESFKQTTPFGHPDSPAAGTCKPLSSRFISAPWHGEKVPSDGLGRPGTDLGWEDLLRGRVNAHRVGGQDQQKRRGTTKKYEPSEKFKFPSATGRIFRTHGAPQKNFPIGKPTNGRFRGLPS